MKKENPLVGIKKKLKQGGETFPEMFQCLGDVAFDGFGRDGEMIANLLVGEVAEPAHGEHLLALGRELFHGGQHLL